jgi:tellurium resistance protein TerZ
MTANLSRGETVALRNHEDGTPLRIRMGLRWHAALRTDTSGSRVRIDLDASALLFDTGGQLVDQVWFQQLRSKDGSIHHSGDNTTGIGEGDLETIRVDLSRLPTRVVTIFFTINSYSGQDFSLVANASCRLVVETESPASPSDAPPPPPLKWWQRSRSRRTPATVINDTEIATYDLSGFGDHTAQIMTKLSRTDDGWLVTALGIPAGGPTYREVLAVLSAQL